MSIQFRPYQVQAINATLKAWQTNQFVLGQMATGGGKTVVGGGIISQGMNGGSSIWLAHTKELVSQPINTFHEFFPELGTIGMMQGRNKDYFQKVTCGTFQTFRSSIDKFLKVHPKIDILVIDEGHRALAKSYLKIIEKVKTHSPDFRGLLLTATPKRGDGNDLKQIYDKRAFNVPMGMLIGMGHLVMPEGKALQIPVDFSKVKTSGRGYDRDYVSDAVSELLDFDNVHEVVYEKWHELAGERSTILFTGTVDHAMHIAEYFSTRGENSAVVSGQAERTGIYINGTFERADRNWIIKQLKKGNINIICNCAVLTEGFDAPIVSCVVNVRPTRNQSLYIQMVGRGLRPYPGKHNCIIIDACPNDARSLVTSEDLRRPKEEQMAIQKAQEAGVIIPELPLEDVGFGIDIDPNEVIVKALNLLGKSKYAWTWQNGLAVCPVGDDKVYCVAVRDVGNGLFEIWEIGKDMHPNFLYEMRDQETALIQGEIHAESAADAQRINGFLAKTAKFRKQKPGQREIEMAKRYGVDNVTSKGNFSQLHFHLVAQEALRNVTENR